VLVPAVERATPSDVAISAEVEERVARLVAAGADEDELRAVIEATTDLGRRSRGS
jgi:hypothetical protein